MGNLGQSIGNKVIAGIDWNRGPFNRVVFGTINHVGRIFIYFCAAVFLISLNGLRRLPSIS